MGENNFMLGLLLIRITLPHCTIKDMFIAFVYLTVFFRRHAYRLIKGALRLRTFVDQNVLGLRAAFDYISTHLSYR